MDQRSSYIKGCLPSKAVFYQSLSSIKSCFPSIFHQRLSSNNLPWPCFASDWHWVPGVGGSTVIFMSNLTAELPLRLPSGKKWSIQKATWEVQVTYGRGWIFYAHFGNLNETRLKTWWVKLSLYLTFILFFVIYFSLCFKKQ